MPAPITFAFASASKDTGKTDLPVGSANGSKSFTLAAKAAGAYHSTRNSIATLALIASLQAAPALANQTPASSSGTGTVATPIIKTYPGGLQPQITLTSNSGAATTVFNPSVALNNVGGVLSSQLSPTTLSATTNSVQIDISATGCAIVAANTRQTCANRGTLTIDFGREVTNPILHVSGFGGSASGLSTNNNAQANYHAALVLTSSAGTLSATPFTVVGSAANLTASTTQIGVTTVNGAAGCAAGAGCGSIRVNGNVSKLVFQLDLSMSSATANTTVISASAGDRFDITASVDEDYGDAPASYNTASTSHIIGNLRMGSGVTVDNATLTNTGTAASPVANANATGDTDDGVTMPTNLGKGAAASIPVAVTGAGALHAWFDWNGNGAFDASENVASAVTDGGAGDTDGAVNGVILLAVTPPTTAVTTQSFARFRYSSASTVNATGLLPDGEVEDYAYTVRPTASLVTTKTLTSGSATRNIGDTVSYTITAQNNGPDQATGVSLTDLLPAGLTAAAGNGAVSQGTYNSSTGLWTIGTLNNGASATLTLVGTVNSGTGGTTITNATTAASTVNQYDPNSTGDDLNESVTILRPIVAANDTVTGVNGATGGTAVTNAFTGDTINGVAASASNATLSVAPGFTVPAGLTFNTATGAVDVAAGTPAGTYSFDYQICDAANPTNCKTATISVTVAPYADLRITKTNNVTIVTSGSTTTFTIVATNDGPSSITGAVVTDNAAAGLTCSPSAPVTITGNGVPGGSYTFSHLSGAGITLGTLANGQSTTLSYSCQVN